MSHLPVIDSAMPPDSAGQVLASTPCSGRTALSNREKQRRWYEKMKADPARYAAFRAKYNAAVRARYHADRLDSAKVERDRATRRRAGRKMWQKIARDPARREKRRINSNLRCVELRDKYVAARLKLTPEACPRELPEPSGPGASMKLIAIHHDNGTGDFWLKFSGNSMWRFSGAEFPVFLKALNDAVNAFPKSEKK